MDEAQTAAGSVGDWQMTRGLSIVGAILAAVVIWVVGKWMIGIARRLIVASMERRKVDQTLVRYADSSLDILLTVVLIMAILGWFGVETTTFAALIAAGGVAIGVAWSGLLSNFAAGIFMIMLRPFKVGDFVAIAGKTGTVIEVGLFVTTITTLDNVRTILGNSKVFGDTIQNFSSNPVRRVELVAQLDHGTDVRDAIGRLEAKLAAIPNVSADMAPEVDLLTFTLAGPVLSVRPYTHNDHYWQVFFDTNLAISDIGGEGGYGVPEQHFQVRSSPLAAIAPAA